MKKRGVGILVLWVAACSSGGSQSGGGTGPGGSSSLGGTWDVVGTRLNAKPLAGKLVVDADHLAVVIGSDSFSAMRDKDRFVVAAGFGGTARALTITPSATSVSNPGDPPVSLGAIPFDVSGSWFVAGASDSTNFCSWSLGASKAVAECGSVGFLPTWIGRPSNASANAQRKSSLASIFGDLGGEWHVALSTGGTCTARFEGSKISASCSGAGEFDGSFELLFDGDVASGSTDRGLELSAKRH
ncbi:MAG: hypothetical protein HYZ29_03315 [Myxococcales bacterium]|nr:hypothetical protein [Myxococcales bacterium]